MASRVSRDVKTAVVYFVIRARGLKGVREERTRATNSEAEEEMRGMAAREVHLDWLAAAEPWAALVPPARAPTASLVTAVRTA